MNDGYLFGYNSTIFPAPVGSTLASLDPATQTILRFFTNVLQLNLGAAFSADALSCGLTHTKLNNFVDGYVVGQAISFPPDSILQSSDVKFPLLSVHRVSRKFTQHSTMKIIIESEYAVTYVLPPLAAEQFNKLYKYLSAISDVLIQRSWLGYDPNYNNGEQVWKTANIAYALLDKDEYGSFLGSDSKTEYPSLKISLRVMEETQFVDSNYQSLLGVDATISNVDGYNTSNPVLHVADGYINPNLSITSISLSTGPVTGNSFVIIIGNGFDNITTSNTITESLTFNNAAASKLIVKSNTSIVAITGPGQTTGTGDIVLTDNFGNVSIVSSGWTYT